MACIVNRISQKGVLRISQAQKLMQCFINDCENLSQTTTSRNEGSHSAFRSNAGVIPKPAESYELRRKHKQQWLMRLRAEAMNARNRIPLDVQGLKELGLLVGHVSLFALTQIKQQILIARKEVADGGEYVPRVQACRCSAHRLYGLPCLHIVPIDGTLIPLESIKQFWKLENWNQGCIIHRMFANLEFIATADTPVRASRPADNISLNDVSLASQTNEVIPYSERHKSHLNQATHDSQRINLELQLDHLLKSFDQAPEHQRSETLRTIDLQLAQLNKLAHIQDPPEMTGRRTFGRGGPRRLTGAEIAEKQLRRQDKPPRQQPTLSGIPIVDLTSPKRRPTETPHSPVPLQRHRGPVITTFSRSGAVVRSTAPYEPSSTISEIQTAIPTAEPEVLVLRSWTADQVLAEDTGVSNQSQTAPPKEQSSSAKVIPPLSPQTSPSRPQRKRKPSARSLGYTGTLVQPLNMYKRGWMQVRGR
jgi:hypothetical protein